MVWCPLETRLAASLPWGLAAGAASLLEKVEHTPYPFPAPQIGGKPRECFTPGTPDPHEQYAPEKCYLFYSMSDLLQAGTNPAAPAPPHAAPTPDTTVGTLTEGLQISENFSTFLPWAGLFAQISWKLCHPTSLSCDPPSLPQVVLLTGVLGLCWRIAHPKAPNRRPSFLFNHTWPEVTEIQESSSPSSPTQSSTDR